MSLFVVLSPSWLFSSTISGSSCPFSFVIPHWKPDPIYVFPEMKLRALVPNFHIHVPMSDSYIPTIGLPILLVRIYKSLTDT
jgi:hypothetical protein